MSNFFDLDEWKREVADFRATAQRFENEYRALYSLPAETEEQARKKQQLLADGRLLKAGVTTTTQAIDAAHRILKSSGLGIAWLPVIGVSAIAASTAALVAWLNKNDNLKIEFAQVDKLVEETGVSRQEALNIVRGMREKDWLSNVKEIAAWGAVGLLALYLLRFR